MKKRHIKKVVVIGSGIMGSGIACHFANIGVEVLLLDIVPRELNEEEKAKGLTLENKQVRNRIVNSSLQAALKSNPSPIYNQKFAERITTGNLEDDIQKIKELKSLINPYLLRRTKQEVAKDLPELSEQIFYSEMSNEQAKLYDNEKTTSKFDFARPKKNLKEK